MWQIEILEGPRGRPMPLTKLLSKKTLLNHHFSKPIFSKSGSVIKIVINFCLREQKQVFSPPSSVPEEARGVGVVLSI